jgi:hypothetical protein
VFWAITLLRVSCALLSTCVRVIAILSLVCVSNPPYSFVYLRSTV